MKYIAGIIGIIMFCVAFVSMATLSSTPPFQYETATLEEKQEWMDGQAQVWQQGARFFLPNGRGPMALNFFLDSIETRPERDEMEMKIRVDVPYGAEVGKLPESEILPTLCKNFVKTALYKNDVRFIVTYDTDKGKRLAKLIVTANRCNHFVSS